MNSTTEHRTCPNCGAAIPVNAPQGVCPKCLMAAAAVSTDAGQTGGKRPEPPSFERLSAAFPQLEVIGFIGQGGMGAVYKARQKQLDRIVALKVLPPGIGSDPSFAERFTREAKALAKLLHPNIVALFEFGQADGIYYLLMEYVDGVSLGQLLRASRVSPREALAIVPQICDALQYAHDQGIVHRDIKPENILLDRRGRVKVADFGLAKLVESSAPLSASLSPSDGERVAARPGEGGKSPALTDAGKVMGTPAYMAPEQVEHPAAVDHRADIYALGVVFYQMLTGELPGKSLEPPSNKVQIDVRLDEVVLRALEKEPKRRYQQASEVKSAVETINARREDEVLAQAEAPLSSDEVTPQAEAVKGRLRLASAALFIIGCACLGGLSSLLLVTNVLPPEKARAVMNYFRPLDLERMFGLYFGSISPLLGALALVTAWQVKRLQGFALAIAAVVLAGVQPVLWPLTVPLGLIALAVLCQKQVRAAFQAQKNLRASRAGSDIDLRAGHRLAVTSAVLVLLSVATAPINSLLRPELPGISGAAVLTIAVLNWFPVYATPVSVMLGWLALFAMRRSAASARGLGYAVFGILFAPMQHVVRWLGLAPNAPWFQPNLRSSWIVSNSLLAILAAALLAWWISRRKAPFRKNRGPTLEFMYGLVWTMGIIVLAYAGALVFGFGRLRFQIGSPTANEISTIFYLNHRHVKAQPESESRTFAGHMALGTLGVQAVCDPVGHDWTCWLPDGTAWCPQRGIATPRRLSRPKQTGEALRLFPARKDSGNTNRELIFYLAGAGDLTTNLERLHFECYVTNRVAEQLCPASRFEFHDRKNYHGFATRVSPEANVARLRLGLPEGPWENTDASWNWTGDERKLKSKSIRHGDEDWEVTVGNVEATADGLSAWFNCQVRWNGTPRLVAVDAEGKVHEPVWRWMPGQEVQSLQQEVVGMRIAGGVMFPGMALSQLKEFRFQIQPYRWVEFRNVSLRPGSHTPVEVMDAKGN